MIMEILEQESVLKSFEILVDTREHATESLVKRCKAFGVPYQRAKLNYGDYSYNITLPNGKKLFDIAKPIDPLCSIERKENLTELSGNFTKNRDRFRREFERAKEHKARLYLICEGASWEDIKNHRYRTKFHPSAYLASLIAWIVRYNLNVTFCKAETSAMMIKEILYRDCKERLENGEFDTDD